MKLKNPLLLAELRKFYSNGWTHNVTRQYLTDHHDISVSCRTLKRWRKHLYDPFWQGPKEPRPPILNAKITAEIVSRVTSLREKTGWGRGILKEVLPFNLSESSYRRIIKENGLSRGSKIENIRIHWVKWQRDHPDSLWQLDSWQTKKGSWIIDVIDDCSRYCLGIKRTKNLTTEIVTKFLDNLILIHGTPREILTDNGAEHGSTSKMSKFDSWCKRHSIIHIRSRVHKPTTTGKVERFHQTVQNELPFCHGDLELFRYRYNHIRPHMSLRMKTPAAVYFNIQKRIKITTQKPIEKWG